MDISQSLYTSISRLHNGHRFLYALRRFGKSFIEDYRIADMQDNLYIDDDIAKLRSLSMQYSLPEICEAIRIHHNAYMRYARLKNRIYRMLLKHGDISFLTLTINDEYIDILTFAEAKDWCKSCFDDWVINEDWGNENNRYHFHAVISGHPDTLTWPYGYYKIQRVNNTPDDLAKIARYCTKLTRHALKITAGGIGYSRKKRKV